MKTTLRSMSLNDREPVMDIFNYYVENSFSACPVRKLPYQFFDTLFGMCQGYPAATARDNTVQVIGFGILRPYNPMPAFSKTAEITYFIKPNFTGQGVGKALLDYLIDGARQKGLTSILASISSLNEGSLRFHLRNSFVECGRFKHIGQKQGRIFYVLYCQITL